MIITSLPQFSTSLVLFSYRLFGHRPLQPTFTCNLNLLSPIPEEAFAPTIRDDVRTHPHLSPSMPPFKILTATHNDGEKQKRFGYKAPTFDAWLDIFLQDEMPDHFVGVLLNLDSDEVQNIKSCVRHHLRFRAVAESTHDVYYPATGPLPLRSRELLCRGGAPQLGWHLSPSKSTTLVRSVVALAVSLDFPHLFKEPASLEEARREWTPNSFNCYSEVPYHFRCDILARLIDICAEDMKKDKTLRAGATDPKPYTKKSTSDSGVTNDTSANKRARTELPPRNTRSSVKREHGTVE
ncbi:hypothetical protein KCU99_g6608, partial [Aureobasidium melanogenum]